MFDRTVSLIDVELIASVKRSPKMKRTESSMVLFHFCLLERRK